MQARTKVLLIYYLSRYIMSRKIIYLKHYKLLHVVIKVKLKTMKKLSVFIMAAALAGLFELAAAQGDQNISNSKAVFVQADKVVTKSDTLPPKKKSKKHRDTVQTPAPTPAPNPNPTPAPSPNPPNPSPNPPVPSPTPTPSPNPPAPTPPTTTPTTPNPTTKPPTL